MTIGIDVSVKNKMNLTWYLGQGVQYVLNRLSTVSTYIYHIVPY